MGRYEYSSCSEMILDFYLENSDRLKIGHNGRKALYTGIIEIQEDLLMLKIQQSYLKSCQNNFDLQTKDIYANLIEEEELKFLGFIYSNYEN